MKQQFRLSGEQRIKLWDETTLSCRQRTPTDEYDYEETEPQLLFLRYFQITRVIHTVSHTLDKTPLTQSKKFADLYIFSTLTIFVV